MNNNLMSSNLNDRRYGVAPQVDVMNSLLPKKEYEIDSWFVLGHFETEGHRLNYLFHIMAIKIPVMGRRYQSVISLSDETTGYYYGKDYLFKEKDVEISDDHFRVKVPNGIIEGTWDDMHIKVDEGDFHVDTHTEAIHYPLLTRGSAVFEALGMTIHQFSVPYMKTKGTLTMNGKTYDITDTGYTWLDRQWQHQNMGKSIKWSWLAIYMDNGDVLSVFDSDEKGKSFMTVLKAEDGSLIHSTNVPLFSTIESDYWTSPKSRQKYPTHWKIKLKDFDAELEIKPIIKEQEIVSVMAPLNKYEASSTVSGTYLGRPATGRATVELIGSWPEK